MGKSLDAARDSGALGGGETLCRRGRAITSSAVGEHRVRHEAAAPAGEEGADLISSPRTVSNS
jgi:hypothetical protein